MPPKNKKIVETLQELSKQNAKKKKKKKVEAGQHHAVLQSGDDHVQSLGNDGFDKLNFF
jgi:hypothetical protein